MTSRHVKRVKILPGILGLVSAFSLHFLINVTGTGYCFEINHETAILDRFTIENNGFDSTNKTFERDEIRNRLFISPLISCSFSDSVEAILSGDAEWTRSTKSPTDTIDFTLRNAYLGWSQNGLSLKAGLQTFYIAKGLILYDDEPGLSAEFKQGSTVLDAKAAIIEDSSPLIELGVAYQPVFFEHVRLFGTWFSDRDNGFAEAVHNALHPTPFSSRGDLYWYGLDIGWFLKKAYLSGIFVKQNGASTLKWKHREKRVHLSAYLLDIGLEYGFSDALSGELFVFVASGDKHPRRGRFKSFIAINPYNSRSAIFFNGGIDEPFSTDKLSLSGITMAGVIAPGVKMTFEPENRFSAELGFTALFPAKRPGGKRDFYGWEADSIFTFHATSNMDCMIEIDYFHLGSFFERRRHHNPSAVLNLIVGFDIFF